MADTKKLSKVRDLLVVLTAVLMVLVVVFQWLEIQKFELQDVIGTRLKSLFVSAESAAPVEAAPAAESGGSAPKSSLKNAVDAKHAAEADAGL